VKNTGARGLRSILESILTEAMYEVHTSRPALLEFLSRVYSGSVPPSSNVCFQHHAQSPFYSFKH
jgi:ATP-dependent protease Clp ATPase subunit